MTYFGGIEAGGTKFVCAIGDGRGTLVAEAQFPTTVPKETLDHVRQFFQEQSNRYELGAVGVGAFGPVDINPESCTYGHILSTPKLKWRGVNLLQSIQEAVAVPVAFDTDVNAAAIGEQRYGHGKGCRSFVYLTVGTGIGGSAVINGHPLRGLSHAEMGHIMIPRHPAERVDFNGSCPYHGACLEGLASGTAMRARWGVGAESLPADHVAWELEAHYLATGLMTYICILSPERIIVGGGVMQFAPLHAMLRAEVQQLLNGYNDAVQIVEQIDQYIVPPLLGKNAGVIGAIEMARRLVEI